LLRLFLKPSDLSLPNSFIPRPHLLRLSIWIQLRLLLPLWLLVNDLLLLAFLRVLSFQINFPILLSRFLGRLLIKFKDEWLLNAHVQVNVLFFCQPVIVRLL
jgi:hypothetical protein